jgi:hypothetical protein
MAFARQDLAASMPAYVTKFRSVLERTNGDVDRAVQETQSLLGEGRPNLRTLLTAIFDTDYVALKVRDAYHHLKTSALAVDPAVARQFDYHLDHWTFQMDAYPGALRHPTHKGRSHDDPSARRRRLGEGRGGREVGDRRHEARDG